MSDTLAASRTRSEQLDHTISCSPHDFRVLTGDRPTGPLHVGHYFGSLRNRVRLQELGVETFVLIADYQVLTDRDVADALPAHVESLLLDYLATGLNPDRAVFFVHSQVPELNQLLLPFLSLVSHAELGRNPTVKEEIAASKQDHVSGLMFTYPAHQAADILACHANLVPVGKDQLPHLELTRTIARRFHDHYGPLFTEPEPLLSDAPALLGVDGQKMSKSRNNAIALSATEDETARLVTRAKTDAERYVSYEPRRRPEVSNLVLLTALCQDRTPEDVADELGDAGSGALKQVVIDSLNERLRSIRTARAEYENDRAELRRILRRGTTCVREVAADTLTRVHARMGMSYD